MLKYKIFIFIILFIFMFFIFSSQVFATTGSYNLDTSSFTAETIEYVRQATLLVKDYADNHDISYSYYFVFTQAKGQDINLNNSNVSFKIMLFTDNVYVHTDYDGVLKGNGIVDIFSFTTGEDLTNKTLIYERMRANNIYDKFRVYYTNFSQENNLVTINDNASFFQFPPQGILAPIVEESSPEVTLVEVVSLVPLIIVVVVFLVGFRKGLAILFQILHKA